jgi:peptide/nickel transport system substrate-binding protein
MLKSSKKGWGAVFLASALAMTLIAPNSSAATKELSPRQVNEKPVSALKQGGTFIYAVNQMPDNFNTSHIDGNEAGVNYMQGTSMPGVFNIDKYGDFVVDTNYVTKAVITKTSPQTITYTLNPKAKWSDGKAIGLADWVGTWKALNGSNEKFEVVSTTGYEDIASVKAGKTNEIVVTFKKTYADWQGLFGGVMPTSLTATPEAFNTLWKTAPKLAAGPFKFQGRDDTAKTVTYVRNTAWWGAKPVLEKIVFRSLPVAAQIDALANGEVDHIDIGPSAPNFKRANGLPGVSVRVSVAPNYRHLTFGQKSEFMKDPLVRQAITTALDRDAIARAMIGPMDPKITSMDNHVFVKGLGCYKNNSGALGEYNLQLADQLLDKAGWLLNADGKRAKAGVVMDLKITIPAAVPTSAQEALMMVSMLKPLGIDLVIDIVPSAPFFSEYITPGNFDLTLFTWLGTALPISSAKSIFSSDGEQNYGKISSPAIDKLFTEANSVLDPAKRCAAITKADALIWKLGHSAILYQRPNIIGMDAKVANMGAWGFTSADWTKVGFVK